MSLDGKKLLGVCGEVKDLESSRGKLRFSLEKEGGLPLRFFLSSRKLEGLEFQEGNFVRLKYRMPKLDNEIISRRVKELEVYENFSCENLLYTVHSC